VLGSRSTRPSRLLIASSTQQSSGIVSASPIRVPSAICKSVAQQNALIVIERVVRALGVGRKCFEGWQLFLGHTARKILRINVKRLLTLTSQWIVEREWLRSEFEPIGLRCNEFQIVPYRVHCPDTSAPIGRERLEKIVRPQVAR
jgi:hypothetical protein